MESERKTSINIENAENLILFMNELQSFLSIYEAGMQEILTKLASKEIFE